MSDHIPVCGSCGESSSPRMIFCESCGRALIVLTARDRAIIRAERDKATRASLERTCPECLAMLPHTAHGTQKFCSTLCRKRNWLASPKGREYERARKRRKTKQVPRVVTAESRQVARLRSEVSRQKSRAELWRHRAVAA